MEAKGKMTLDIVLRARFVCDRSMHVTINPEGIDRLARLLVNMPLSQWNYEHHFYDGSERTVSYLLMLDALNFCFFPEPRWQVVIGGEQVQGYFGLASVLKQAFMIREPPIDDFSYLMCVKEEQVRTLLQGEHPIGKIPLLKERVTILRELGDRMVSLYQGKAANLIEDAGGSAIRLTKILVEGFPSFCDEAWYAGEKIAFYKRAQILVSDLYASFHGKSFGALREMEKLTAFADYKVPQILRNKGVLNYSEALARVVDSKGWIRAGSAYEVEIRAGMIVAVELLRAALLRLGRALLSIEIDWLLWDMAQGREMAPHHRTLTTFY